MDCVIYPLASNWVWPMGQYQGARERGQGIYCPDTLPVWPQVAETALHTEGCRSRQRPLSTVSAFSGLGVVIVLCCC